MGKWTGSMTSQRTIFGAIFLRIARHYIEHVRRFGRGFIKMSPLIASAVTISVSHAAIQTVPNGLLAGDQYRLVFITLDKITATSSDINTYNAFVTAQANSSAELAALNTTWRIIGSTQSVDAKVNTLTDDSGPGPDGVPIFRLDGVVVADNYDDLWDGTIDNPIYVAQDGTVLNTCCGSWTGTLISGLNAGLAALGASSSVVDGAPNRTDDFWVQSNPYTASELQYVYGMSGVLTVPEPSVMFLFGTGLVGLAALRLNSRHA